MDARRAQGLGGGSLVARGGRVQLASLLDTLNLVPDSYGGEDDGTQAERDEAGEVDQTAHPSPL